ncbi:helix-turn-helix transcriptional regulator [Nocardia puris]|uniref:helix-turn-helix transcriptional regulator n=1 Tax=Nocardia TaxID=1817 RepID=UPI0011DD16A1|nr:MULTISPECIES: helix-turn-helix transcriptional regulator [Nocardia]MBF6137158.1 helix-turn-helix transcriptional regulator [Nocardia otitidiscaviarum]MBF6181762.1 helix-turn-helix transcriptional regulator [Nocardia otitidiscaviarum]MBF6213964.1 helix-turn-helix transcriptional regulator [Nocardia puris]MBF6368740.1 helix-turn-helix transcriptional regulator [Nocardia puris]MBF6461655.1 helix-turn-helix transcriptional regulator [Nocardia puris]
MDHMIKRRGWTRRDAADAVNVAYEQITGRPGAYTEERIRRLIRGEITWPHPEYRRALEEVFGVPVSDLGLFNRRRGVDAYVSTAQGGNGVSAWDIEAMEGRSEMNRRNVMEAIAVLGAASPAVLVGTSGGDETERLAGPVSAPWRVDDATFDIVEVIVNHAKLQDDLLGPRAALGTMLSQARLMDSLLVGVDGGRLRSRALVLRSHIGVSSGWQCFDLGHHSAAAAHFTVAREAADEAGAHDTSAMAMAEWSWTAGAIGAATLALDLAAAAESRAAVAGDPRLRAHAAGIAGVALARLGHAREARAALTRAVTPDIEAVRDPAESIAYFCDPAHIARLRAETLRCTGDTAAAISAATEAIALQPRRDSAETYVLLGTLHLEADDINAAVAAFLTAADTANQSPRVAGQLRSAQDALETAAPRSSAVRLLDDRLSDLQPPAP